MKTTRETYTAEKAEFIRETYENKTLRSFTIWRQHEHDEKKTKFYPVMIERDKDNPRLWFLFIESTRLPGDPESLDEIEWRCFKVVNGDAAKAKAQARKLHKFWQE